MSIRVMIGNSERNVNDMEPSWIIEQVMNRRKHGQQVCVVVKINQGDLNMTLATADCPSGGSGGRTPNHAEKEVFDLWDKFKLGESDFNYGNLIAFLKQISS